MWSKKYSAKTFLKECGTTACGLGWGAVVMPTLLRMDEDGDIMHVSPTGAEYYNMGAAVKVFGITLEEAHNLFLPRAYALGEKTKAINVAVRMEKLLKDYARGKGGRPISRLLV